MKTISLSDYYMALGAYIAACQKQTEVRFHEKVMTDLIGEGVTNDAVYNPDTKSTKVEFDDFIKNMGIVVEWNPADKKEKKETNGSK